MKLHNGIILTTLVAVLATVTMGCTPSKDTLQSGNKNAKLKWMMMGPGKQQDANKVWTEYNKKLQQLMPGVNVDFEIIPSSDYAEKYKLITAARESVDILWVGWMLPYLDEARSGTYAELDDLINENAAELKAEMPDWVWDLAKVDGKIYSIPNYQMFVNGNWGLRTPKALSEKYWDAKKAEQIFLSKSTFTAECYDYIENYLSKIKADGKLQQGISTYFPVWTKGYEEFFSPYVIKIDDTSFKVQNKWLTPEAKLYFDRFASWFKKGYIRSDILSIQNIRQDEAKKDGNVMWMHSVLKGEEERQSTVAGFPVSVVPMVSDFYIPSTANSTSTAIASISKNKETAIKLLSLMSTKKGSELYNLLTYGIEGEHFTKEADGRIKQNIASPGNPLNNDKYGLVKWAIGNTYYAYETQADTKGWNDYIKNEVNGTAVKSKIISFKPDSTPIKTEIAQVQAVLKEYTKMLMSGALPNYEQKYNEFVDKLSKAGNQKIVDELQRQLNEYNKTKN